MPGTCNLVVWRLIYHHDWQKDICLLFSSCEILRPMTAQYTHQWAGVQNNESQEITSRVAAQHMNDQKLDSHSNTKRTICTMGPPDSVTQIYGCTEILTDLRP